MNKRELWTRLAARPNAVRFGELEALLMAFGWEFERSGKGDHVIYRRGNERFSVPYRRGAVLAVYVRRILRLTAEEEGYDDRTER